MTPQDKALKLREAVVASNSTNHSALIGGVGASQFPIGGVVAFHEIAVYDAFEARPAVPLWQEVGELIGQAFRSVMLHPDIAGRMIEQFHRAGLGQPMVFCEQPVAGGHDFAAYSWAVNLLRSLVPQLEAIGVVIDGIGIGTLEDRLRDTIAAVNGQACLPRQFCCWSQV